MQMQKGKTQMKHLLISLLLVVVQCSPALAGNDLTPFFKWTRVMKSEKIQHVNGSPPRDVLEALKAIGEKHAHIRFVEDRDQYGKQDYWATRAELKKRNAGDCEDFAIAAYFDLLEQGVPDDQMRIIVAQRPLIPGLHAYLQVGDLVYDRRGDDRWDVVSVEKARQRYVPLYSINRQGWEFLCPADVCNRNT
jgi:predicted transglutaminase-like cysteine proteinase